MPNIRRSFVAAALVLCALLVLSLIKPTVANASPFWSDLPDELLGGYGLTQQEIGEMSNGYLDGTWRPSECVTRGQFVRIASDYLGVDPFQGFLAQQHFSDVPRSSPYYSWVETALEVGLIQGYQTPTPAARTIFGLYDPTTREQAIAILMRYLSKMQPSTLNYSTYTAERSNQLLAPFVDRAQVRRTQEVAMALDTKVLRPLGATLTPQASLTRIQAAALIARTRSVLPMPPPDESTPPTTSWSGPLSWLASDANLAGIQLETRLLGSPAPWMPRTLTLRAQVEVEQDPNIYQATAVRLVSLAEKYRDQMKYEQVHVVLTIERGTVVYDHTFQ